MNARYLFAGLAALAASMTMSAQQGAPNEGRALQGPALRIERNVEYARAGAVPAGLKNNREFASCAVESARELPRDSVVVTILCDGGERYMSERFWTE